MAKPSKPSSVPQAELTIRVSSDIVRLLLEAHTEGRTVDLNALKSRVAKKHGSTAIPRLVDIIAAVPQEVRDILLPKLRAKPVRTASGVRCRYCFGSRGRTADFERTQIAIVAVMSKPHRCPHIAMTGNICVYVSVWNPGKLGRNAELRAISQLLSWWTRLGL